MEQIETFIAACVTGTAGLIFWAIKRRFDKQQKQQDEREKQQEEKERQQQEILYLLIQTVWASATLSEANAMAIESGKHNGELKRALGYMKEVRDAQKNSITKLGLKEIF